MSKPDTDWPGCTPWPYLRVWICKTVNLKGMKRPQRSLSSILKLISRCCRGTSMLIPDQQRLKNTDTIRAGRWIAQSVIDYNASRNNDKYSKVLWPRPPIEMVCAKSQGKHFACSSNKTTAWGPNKARTLITSHEDWSSINVQGLCASSFKKLEGLMQKSLSLVERRMEFECNERWKGSQVKHNQTKLTHASNLLDEVHRVDPQNEESIKQSRNCEDDWLQITLNATIKVSWQNDAFQPTIAHPANLRFDCFAFLFIQCKDPQA